MARVFLASTGRQGREVERVMMRQGSWEARWVCTVFPWHTGGQSMHLACKVGGGGVLCVSWEGHLGRTAPGTFLLILEVNLPRC